MKIALVTDAWMPQVNGVVRTLRTIVAIARRRGHEVEIVAPDQFRSIGCPTYPEIRLALVPPGAIARRMRAIAPDAVHIATEGPLGWAARRWCLRMRRPFTTAYHTQFPQYLSQRTGIRPEIFWPMVRRFHAPADTVMVATPTIRAQLSEHGFTDMSEWSRGVDTAVFSPDHAPPDIFYGLPRPIQLYVGRVSVEKNIEAFLANTHPGSKVVVGEGPALADLSARFPQALFLGSRSGPELAACYAGADVFVFPSRTDTFGLVMIEALACGTPVAAFPVPGPLDVLGPESGVMAERLEDAITGALRLDRADCLAHGSSFSWEASADQFLRALVPVPAASAADPASAPAAA